MKIKAQYRDLAVQINFGRRAGIALDPGEADVLCLALAAYLAGEPPGDWPDLGVYVIDGTYAEDHVQVCIQDAWFEITIDEASDLKAELKACLASF